MDCDLSHDPADVPRLIEAARGAGLAIGSRYVRGGSAGGLSPRRRLLSRVGSIYARVVLGLGLHDLTGGFKCYRREALETLDLDRVAATGYAFQIETTYRIAERGFAVVEVPIAFGERAAGKSKMRPRIALEALWRVPALRLQTTNALCWRRRASPGSRRMSGRAGISAARREQLVGGLRKST
jgi:dolichol-phosphate mannosyltransferase